MDTVKRKKPVGIGIIGCGNISSAYLTAAKMFPILDITAIADRVPEAAAMRAAEFGLTATSVEALLADPAIEMVINLTVPAAHVEVGLMSLAAGKHVYSEKPLGVKLEDGRKLLATATELGLRVGSAPDTFLGGGHQICRHLVDEGKLGVAVGGTATFMCPGHERWHPNPDFYYQAGGGPMFDMGPYYITDLVNLLGPVRRVAGMVSMPRSERAITSTPRNGETIHVDVPTHVTGTLEFVGGALVQIAMSFDVAAHKHTPIEIYGTEGTVLVPDPNRFGGPVGYFPKGGEWQDVAVDAAYSDGNFRSIGAADMAHAIRDGRPHRANGELALHVLEVMAAFDAASQTGHAVTIESRPERPAPLSTDLVDGALA